MLAAVETSDEREGQHRPRLVEFAILGEEYAEAFLCSDDHILTFFPIERLVRFLVLDKAVYTMRAPSPWGLKSLATLIGLCAIQAQGTSLKISPC
jgi:hypothetical protein